MRRLLLTLVVLAGAGAAAPSLAQNFGLRQSIVGASGGSGTGAAHRLVGTVGESIAGEAANLSTAIRAGFWCLSGLTATAVADPLPGAGPERSFLRQNAPNPFNPVTTISFRVGWEGPVELEVYDLMGRRIRDLWHGPLPAGDHAVRWDGTDASGRTVGSGVYIARLKTAAGSASRRMVVVK